MAYAGPCIELFFLSRVYHPAFNIDAEQASEVGTTFEKFVKGLETGMYLARVEAELAAMRRKIFGV